MSKIVLAKAIPTCMLLLLGLLLPCLRAAAEGERWHAASMRLPARQAAPPLEDMAHTSWTRRDGAPSDIAALAQTSEGYLWIGSRLGLFRFDGLQFQSYPFHSGDPQLPASDISALAADRDGGLWIGYRMGGISYLKDGRKVDYDRSSGLVGESTEQLVCRDDGSVWATADGRLMHLDGSRWQNYSAAHGLDSDGLYSLFFDRDGDLWTAAKQHVYVLRRGERRFVAVAEPGTTVNQFAQRPDGQIWVTDAWKSVRPLEPDGKRPQGQPQPVRVPGVPVMVVDRQGSLWLAHDFGGLTRIRFPGGDRREVDNYGAGNGLTDGQTRALLVDRQGSVWVATARGLDRFRHSPVRQFSGVRLDYYPALAADRTQGIWFNDMDKPLMRLRNGQLSFIGVGHGSSTLFQDGSGGMWLLDPITHEFFRYPESGGEPERIAMPEVARDVETWCLGQDVDGALMAGFEGHGLWRYRGQWQRMSDSGLPQESPLSLMRGACGRVWLGYAHNQVALQDGSGWHLYGPAQGLELNSVFAFYDEGELMLAGGSDGLAFRDRRGFHNLRLREPGLLRGISGIVRDRSGDLWLNAGLGVLRLPASELQAALHDPHYPMDFQLLNERDGLIGSPAQTKPTPSAVMDRDGTLWFATSGHLVSVDPAQARLEGAAPNVLLQAVLVNGSVRRPASDMSIVEDAHRLKTVEFDYIGVDLQAPDRVHYQYMLEEQDREWQEVGTRRQAYYTNLAPGRYRFRVRAASGTGQWSELSAPLALTIHPAFYQTGWFYLAIALLALGMLWLIYRIRLHAITAKMQERLEERAGERVRIARDLHDTLLQGVQGLVLRFHYAAEKLPPDEPVRELLMTALDRADQVIGEGRDRVRQLRADRSAPGDLERELGRAIEALKDGTAAEITLSVTGHPRRLHATVQDELYCVGREALTNAVRHASAAKIVVELAYETRVLSLRCCDDGCGVDQDILQAGFRQGHFGFLGMRERAQRLGCKLELRSARDAGTAVEVRVPGRRAYAPESRDSWATLLQPASVLEPSTVTAAASATPEAAPERSDKPAKLFGD